VDVRVATNFGPDFMVLWQSGAELDALPREELRRLADKENCADAQLLLTARAIKESTGLLRYCGEMRMVLVLAPSYLDPVNTEYANRKRDKFRFIRPDGSGIALDPDPEGTLMRDPDPVPDPE
jgi:hypothetical protein